MARVLAEMFTIGAKSNTHQIKIGQIQRYKILSIQFNLEFSFFMKICIFSWKRHRLIYTSILVKLIRISHPLTS